MWGDQNGPVSAYDQVPFFVKYVVQYVYYCVIPDFVQKALLSEKRQLEVGGVTMYDKG